MRKNQIKLETALLIHPQWPWLYTLYGIDEKGDIILEMRKNKNNKVTFITFYNIEYNVIGSWVCTKRIRSIEECREINNWNKWLSF